MTKSRKSRKPQVRRPSRAAASVTANSRAGEAPTETVEDRWEKLRQGARNVAGVTWQIAVTAHLLLASRVGDLPFARLTPEGYEDIDCVSADGLLTLVQVKEKGAGAGRMAAAAVAEVLAHALTAKKTAPGSLVALVTDGELGSDLEFTGWHSTVAETSPASAVDALSERLREQDLSDEQVADIVHRARFVRLPWNLRGSSEFLLHDRLELHPAIASLVVGELYAHLGSIAAEQRSTTADTSRSVDLSDVDSFVRRLQSTVDMTGLDVAVLAGICAPADFTVDPDLRLDQFYLGVDGAPAHIAAGLDVLRPRELTQMVEAAGDERYALLSGPSGCGKSVLLWRAARDAVLGSRLVRVHRVSSDEDVELLRRHVELARPTKTSPIVVVADNLGRPHMERWPDLVGRLRELPSVILFGACRAEDFHPRIARGAARIVQPELDEATADDIAVRLASSGLSQAMAPTEAFRRSDGLLMEYLALLLRGKRLGLIIAEQAAGLSEPGRELQRSAARLVAVAHSLGFSLRADVLAAVLAPDAPPESVGDALNVLRGEHVITVDGASWRGLHELRSRTLADLLHESPPPSFGDTLCSVSRCLTLSEASWLLRRAAERYPRWASDVARALAHHIADPDLFDARAVAEVLEGAERADNLLYARECLPILQKHRPTELTVFEAAPLAYGIRHQGLYRGETFELAVTLVQKLRLVTSAMPVRPDLTLTVATSRLTNERVLSLLTSCDLADKVRLLEALTGKVRLHDQEVKQVLDSSPAPCDRPSAALWSRLIESLFEHLSAHAVQDVLGDIESRAETIARAEPWAISVEADRDGPSVTVLQALSEEAVIDELPWEPSRSVSGDVVEAIAIALAKRLAFACPDAKVVKVRTLTPAGRPMELDGHEYAHRTIPTESFPSRIGVRRNVGFNAAIRRLSAAETWTEILTAQVELGGSLVVLAESARRRLNPHDNARRREEWTAQVNEAKLKVALVKPEPAPLDPGLPSSHAKADAAERESDPITSALDSTAQALTTIVSNQNLAAVAMTVNRATRRLRDTREGGIVVLPGLGEPVPAALVAQMARLADLAAAAHSDPGHLGSLSLHDGQAVDEFINRVSTERGNSQAQVIDTALASVPGRELYVLRNPGPDRIATNDTAILVTVPLDSWQTAAEIIGQLDDTFKQALDAQVIVAPLVNGKLRTSGLQLRRYGSTSFLPAPPATVQAFAESAGVEVSADGEDGGPQQLINELLRVSWLATLHKLRPSTWEISPDLLPPSVFEPPEQSDELLTVPGAGEAIDLLLKQINDELHGESDTTVAGVVIDSQTGVQEFSTGGIEILASLAVLATSEAIQ